MAVEDWKNAAEIVQGFSASVALLAGGWWAWRNAQIEARYEESLELTIRVRVLRSQDPTLRVLEIRLAVKNAGKVPCQVELARSAISVSRVDATAQAPNVVWQADPYFVGRLEEDPKAVMNVPVGAGAARVTFVGVPHPGLYGVRAQLALTEANTRRYYKRLKMPFPKDWRSPENAVYWDDSVMVTTEGETAGHARDGAMAPVVGAGAVVGQPVVDGTVYDSD
jgi:hypothetical protein